MTDLTEKYHIAKPVCKKEGFRLKKEHCLCVKKKTRKLKPKLKIVKSLESVKVPKKSKSSDKKPPSMENEPMHQMIMQTLQKKVKTPTPPPAPPGSPVSPYQHLKKATPAKSKTAKKVRKRCPKGTQKNPETGRCVNKETLKKMKKQAKRKKSVKKTSVKRESAKRESVKKASNLEKVLDNIVKVQEKQIALKAPRKRCPKGTRKNPKTGQCEPASKVMTKKKTSPKKSTPKKKTTIIVPSNTPAIQEDLGNKIASILSKSDLKYKKQKIQQSINSFSPEVNKKLVTKRKSIPGSAINEITSCINFDKYVGQGPKVFVKGVGCKPYFSAKAQDTLMKALSYSRKNLKMGEVIAPKQAQSNCWFNTMFMTFFVSDKGRKFYKFFRQLMITGKKADGTIIKPPRLQNAFASLNLAIEASLSGSSSFDNFNTNLLIKQIYSGIPSKFRMKAIKNAGVANNPLAYYQAIMYYLKTENVKLANIYFYDPGRVFRGYIENEINYYVKKQGGSIPEVLAIELPDKISTESSPSSHKPNMLSFPNVNGENITYKLDSAVVRDTKKKHFCCVLEIGGKQCGFDGASFRKLSEFNWKPLLNSDKDWTFEGSTWDGTTKDILWNFKNGYQILFYYRI